MSGNFINIDGWIAERIAGTKKAPSVLMSILGDVVVPHGGVVALGSLVTAAGLLGVNETTVRSSVNRLQTDDWLANETLGRRSFYRLSNTGKRRFDTAYHRVYSPSDSGWDGNWHLVVLDPSAASSDVIADMAKDLRWGGYGKISDTVFIKPKSDSQSMCKNILSSPGRQERPRVCFTAQTPPCMDAEPLDKLIRRAWDMDTLESRYKAFVTRYNPMLAAVWDAIADKRRLDPKRSFILRAFLIHDYRRARLIDPMLPMELLPESWLGDRAFYITHELYDMLTPASERFVMETFEGADGQLPQLDTSFYDRFGGLSRKE